MLGGYFFRKGASANVSFAYKQDRSGWCRQSRFTDGSAVQAPVNVLHLSFQERFSHEGQTEFLNRLPIEQVLHIPFYFVDKWPDIVILPDFVTDGWPKKIECEVFHQPPPSRMVWKKVQFRGTLEKAKQQMIQIPQFPS